MHFYIERKFKDLPSRIRNKEAKPKVEMKSYKDVSKLHTFTVNKILLTSTFSFLTSVEGKNAANILQNIGEIFWEMSLFVHNALPSPTAFNFCY